MHFDRQCGAWCSILFAACFVVVLTAALPLFSSGAAGQAGEHYMPPAGPLRVCAATPRYFADPSGRPVYLTGSHTWQSLQDGILPGYTTVTQPFDYQGYLHLLQANHHNFIRLWRWELTNHEPQPELATTGYCLAKIDRRDPQYLIYLPKAGSATVNLAGTQGDLAVEWFRPESGETTKGKPVQGGGSVRFQTPFQAKDAVLYLRRTE